MKMEEDASISVNAELDDLRNQVELLHERRLADHDRYKRAVLERDVLRGELASLMVGREPSSLVAADDDEVVKPSELLAPALRSDHQPFVASGLFDKVLASILLSHARRAASQRQYARAEIFYQAILQLKPRAFIWKQVAKMMSAQGLYRLSAGCLEKAAATWPGDAETHFLWSVVLKHLGREARSDHEYANAISLDRSFSSRSRD